MRTRLTESDLTRIVRRVLKEDDKDCQDKFDNLNNELKKYGHSPLSKGCLEKLDKDCMEHNREYIRQKLSIESVRVTNNGGKGIDSLMDFHKVVSEYYSCLASKYKKQP